MVIVIVFPIADPHYYPDMVLWCEAAWGRIRAEYVDFSSIIRQGLFASDRVMWPVS